MKIETILYAALLGVCALAPSLHAKEVIKIGVILPLSGNQAQNGEDIRDTLLMRLKEQKPDAKFEYKLIMEDDQCAPRQTIEAFWKLKNFDHINMVMSMYATPSCALAPIANGQGIIHMGLGLAGKIAMKPYSFNNFSKSDQFGKMAAQYCRAMGFKRVAMLNVITAATQPLLDAFAKYAKDEGIEVVSNQSIPPPERDFRVAILKIREAKPDVLFINAFNPEASIIARQIKDIAYEVPVTSLGYWGTITNPAPFFFGWPYVAPATSPVFAERFTKAYHRNSLYFAGMAYDSLDMMIASCEKYTGAGKPNADFIAKELNQIKNFPGVMGPLTPDKNGWFDSPTSFIVTTPEGRQTVSLDEAVRLAKEKTKGIK